MDCNSTKQAMTTAIVDLKDVLVSSVLVIASTLSSLISVVIGNGPTFD